MNLLPLLLSSLLAVPSGGTDFRIGVLYWSMNIPGQVAMRDGLEAEAERLNEDAQREGRRGFELIPKVAGDGEDGIANQIEQMYELIRLRVDLIVVQPTDNAALIAPLKEANDADIPVVAYDQYISGGQLAAYFTSDNYGAGYLGGEYIAAQYNDETTMRVVLVEYPHVSSTVERVNGFLRALGDRRQPYTILKTYSAVEPVSGKRAVKSLLSDFPDENSIDVVFTVNDGGGLAVVDGLADAGRSEIRVVTVDGDPASVDNIRNGRNTVFDAAQFCGPLGEEAIRAGLEILRGGTPPRHALVPVFPITRETIGQYPGWQGPVPEPFTKPWPSDSPMWEGALKIVEP